LYLRALAHYREQTLTSMRATFAAARTTRNGFSTLLLGLVAETPEQHARGCLLLSANLERETGDTVIAQFLRQNQASVERIFSDAIAAGQDRGELAKTLDAEALGRFFAATVQGMRAMARLKSDRRALRQIARVALGTLDAG
jgi:TetR/AcrR family transcriptional repressor of nem operon